jgi:hypothetical protein
VLDEGRPHRLLVHLGRPLQLGQRLELVDGVVGHQHGLRQPLDGGLVPQLARILQEHEIPTHRTFGITANVRRRHRRDASAAAEPRDA